MKYGLIGKTLVHSYSKEIHEALGKYSYQLFSLTEEDMPQFVSGRDFAGLNVTIPYKQAVIPLCDQVTPLASAIGAVNTLYREPAPGSSVSAKSRLIGHNTDYEGFLYAAKRAGIDFSGKPVLIMGTGGTSLMARKAIADSGASQIFIASRSSTPKNAEKIASSISVPIKHMTYEELPSIMPNVKIIVNTTPVGTYPNNMASIISLEDFTCCEAVIDVIYNPFKTQLILDAERLGLKYSNGLPMLVAQATAAAGYFLGTPGAFECQNESIICNLEKKMQNIVLIGMPGCGKSTIGRLLAEKTGKKLIDMDLEIQKRASMSIPEIFSTFGESYFRDMESTVAAQLGKEHGLVIATGGGAILRSENLSALRQNGFMVHITRPVDILPTRGRPLSKNQAALKEMEAQRLPLYKAAADITFDNSEEMTEDELKTALDTLLPL